MMQKNAAFDWDCYLHLAKSFLEEIDELNNEDGESEAKIRCGMSRAYYSALHNSRIFLHKIKIYPSFGSGSSHDNVINQFKKLYEASNDKERDKTYMRIYNDLRLLKSDRIKADYYDRLIEDTMISKNVRRNLLDKSIRRTEKILEGLSLLNTH